MNQFESLCKLASDETWCWKLFCTTCGHMHFRYAFSELALGKSPEDMDWLVHGRNTRYSSSLGSLPRSYTEEQKEVILDICIEANIFSIASNCTFPDWLGYLGLVLDHMHTRSETYNVLSVTWAQQLAGMVSPSSHIHDRLEQIINDNGTLNLKDLESCEMQIFTDGCLP